MRKPIIVGNWKMNKTIAETKAFCEAVDPEVNDSATFGIATPYLDLQTALATHKVIVGDYVLGRNVQVDTARHQQCCKEYVCKYLFHKRA